MLGEIVGLAREWPAATPAWCIWWKQKRAICDAGIAGAARADLGNLRMKIGEGVTGWVAEHQSPVALASRASQDSRFKCSLPWWKTPTRRFYRCRWSTKAEPSRDQRASPREA